MNLLTETWRFRRYHRLGDDEWLHMLRESIHGRAALPMPSFPDPSLQSGFVGSSNEVTVQEAWNFYALMGELRSRHGPALSWRSHVLDFGCGWGRFARMFRRDVPASNIWCADAWDLALDTCRETGVRARLVQLQQMPPSTLPSRRFDTAFAYSVFSHLSPVAHQAWRDEFVRVMKPGALVFITTQARWFVDNCRRLRENPAEVTHPWYELLAGSFLDHDESLARYDRGEMIYAPNGGGPALLPDYYGDAVVPLAFFEREWAPHFEVLEFIADKARFEQAVVVMRRVR